MDAVSATSSSRPGGLAGGSEGTERWGGRSRLAGTEPQNDSYYGTDGVDVTLIRWMLALTPAERLQVLQQAASSLDRLCRAKPIH